VGRLHRTLTVWDGVAVAVGSVIGTAIFRLTGQVFLAAGSAGGALAIWIGLGLASLAGAFVYADLAVRVPEAGGAYAYVREGFGPFAAFLDGWITVGAGNPALQAAGCALIGELLARLLGLGPLALGGWAERLLALGAVAALGGLNWIGVRVGAGTQKLFTAFKLVALSGVVVLALVARRTESAGLGSMPARLPFILALTGAWYAYVGWQDGALLAEDLRDPRRDLPRVLIGSVTVVVLAYVSVNAAILFATRGGPVAGAAMPALELAKQVLGVRADRVMSAVILLSMIGGTAEGFMVHPRLGFALARDGFAPRVLARVNRGGTPAPALAMHCVLITLLVLTGRFDQILALLAFTQAIQAVLEASAYFAVRRRIKGPQLTPLHPVLPLAFVAANAALAVWVARDSWRTDPGRVLWGVGIVAAVAVAFGVRRLVRLAT
jgi:APA family basic amino acid/polyamine antiporter